ncbi:hypothetical protein JFV30_14390 [Pseudomonas sp. TH32]|uniref:hypothetical protein n=1 Tax=Pseudomonas sp. TH32 TaxID=2796397 RepID=UPI00191337E4|nr:hypothetical protein [Pseudomonas sp. TH32]MBK5437966.1 hypothetical protein [Pseudomonas sp. TH32]
MNIVKGLFKVVLSLWFTLSLIACFGVYTALSVYRQEFSGGYSSKSADWSAFGSYMGGVLGPLVSFLTLVAVVRTVYLQRELLSAQREEALALKIAAAQDTSVKAIDMLMAMQEKDYDRYLELAFKYHEEHRDELGDDPDIDTAIKEKRNTKLRSLLDCRDRARRGVALFSMLALNIATGKFYGVEEVREKLKFEVESVYKKLDEEYPSTANKKVPVV